MDKKILIVDDDKNIRKLLELQLNKAGYRVANAENGRKCIQLLDVFSPDLVLIDIFMPVMDGFEAIIEIRKRYKRANLPIIVLSSEKEKKEWVKAIKLGANDFVQKPFDKTELLARIGTNLTVADLNNKLISRTKELAEKNAILENEKKLAAEIQQIILPDKFEFRSLEMESFYCPSMNLSGDFYDAFQVKDRITFMVGDVSGHGTAAALLMFAARSLLNSFGQAQKTVKEIIALVNRFFCDMVGDSGHHLTLVFGIFDQKTGKLMIASAGHVPFLLIKKNEIESLGSTGMPIGFDPNEKWDEHKISFNKGDGLFIYTDGLTDAADAFNVPFGKSQLLDIVRKKKNVKDQVGSVSQAVLSHCKEQLSDDITILAIKRV